LGQWNQWWNGSPPSNAVPLTVNKYSTTTSLSSSPTTTSVSGQDVTFTATVSPSTPGTGIPKGTVTFLDGTRVLGTVDLSSSGTATYSTPSLSIGSHTIKASYSGDNSFLSSSNTLSQTVSKIPTQNSLNAFVRVSPLSWDQKVSILFSVWADHSATITPTGT